MPLRHSSHSAVGHQSRPSRGSCRIYLWASPPPSPSPSPSLPLSHLQQDSPSGDNQPVLFCPVLSYSVLFCTFLTPFTPRLSAENIHTGRCKPLSWAGTASRPPPPPPPVRLIIHPQNSIYLPTPQFSLSFSLPLSLRSSFAHSPAPSLLRGARLGPVTAEVSASSSLLIIAAICPKPQQG